MDIKDLTAALRRWWGLSLLMVLLAVSAGTAAFLLVGPSYTAVSSVVLLPPEATVDNAARGSNYAPANPLLYLAGLNQSRDLVLQSMGARDVQADLTSKFPGAVVDASPAVSSSGPVLILTSTASSGSEAVAAMRYASGQVPVVLSDLQDSLKIQSSFRITSMTLTADTSAQILRKSQLQVCILSFLAVMAIGTLGIGAFDHLTRTRRRWLMTDPATSASDTVESAVFEEMSVGARSLPRSLAPR